MKKKAPAIKLSTRSEILRFTHIGCSYVGVCKSINTDGTVNFETNGAVYIIKHTRLVKLLCENFEILRNLQVQITLTSVIEFEEKTIYDFEVESV